MVMKFTWRSRYVSIWPNVGLGPRRILASQAAALHEIGVQIAVAVHVEQRCASSEDLGEHELVHVARLVPELQPALGGDALMIINCSGRGDKDVAQAAEFIFGEKVTA